MSPNHNLYCADCLKSFRSSQPEGHNRRCSNRQFASFGRCLRCSNEHASPGASSQCKRFSDTVSFPTESITNICNDSSDMFEVGNDSRSPSPPANISDVKVFKFDGLKEGTHYEADLHKSSKSTIDARLSFNLPSPRELQLPAASELTMSPIELELMLFINDNFLPPSMFDSLMCWARRAMESGYQFNAPTHRTLQKRLNEVFPPNLYGGKVLSKLFSAEELELDQSITLFYFDPLELIGAKLRDPSFMKDFVCFPEIKRTVCGQRIYDEVTSAKWFETAFNNSPATANGQLIPGSLFVGLCDFDDKSCIDKLMKVSEHPFLMSFLNLPLEA